MFNDSVGPGLVLEESQCKYSIVGSDQTSQLEDLGALDVAKQMTDEHMKALGVILNNAPEVYSGFGGGGWQRRLDTL